MMNIERNIKDCPLTYTLSVMGGKWKILILYYLYIQQDIRYGELKRCIGDVSHKVLNNQLKELIEDEMIIRKEYAQVPPKVEYQLSEKGKTLIPILKEMYLWGEANRE